MKKQKRRISLSFKIHIIVIALVIVHSVLLVSICYRAYCNKVDDYSFSRTEHAAQILTYTSPEPIENLWQQINTDEFRQIREDAIDADDETIIANWMREKPGVYADLMTYEYSDHSASTPGEGSTLYDDYTLLSGLCGEYAEILEMEDIYVLYEEGGISYNLVDPDESLLYLGYPSASPGDFDEYGDNEQVPATVYHSEYGWLCTACSPILSADGRAIGLCGADLDMNDVMQERHDFLVNSIVFIIIALIVIFVVSMLVVKRFFLKPVKMLTGAAAGFAGNSEGYSREDIINLPIHSNDEIGDLYREIKSMQGRIVDSTERLTSITAERERVETELRMAAAIQNSMLPESFPAVLDQTRFDLYASMDPAKEVGGDFYDYFLIDEDHLCILIADVSDKGVPAALFMMSSKMMINYRAREGGTPAEILTSVNAELIRGNSAKMFVTVWMGILDLNSGKMTCCNAGHENPIIRREDGIFHSFSDKHGLMIGALKKVKQTDYELILNPGDAIFIYTDGVPEATNSDGEFYGMERLEGILNKDSKAAPQRILEDVRNDIDAFTHGERQFDDLTMLCLEYNGPA